VEYGSIPRGKPYLLEVLRNMGNVRKSTHYSTGQRFGENEAFSGRILLTPRDIFLREEIELYIYTCIPSVVIAVPYNQMGINI